MYKKLTYKLIFLFISLLLVTGCNRNRDVTPSEEGDSDKGSEAVFDKPGMEEKDDSDKEDDQKEDDEDRQEDDDQEEHDQEEDGQAEDELGDNPAPSAGQLDKDKASADIKGKEDEQVDLKAAALETTVEKEKEKSANKGKEEYPENGSKSAVQAASKKKKAKQEKRGNKNNTKGLKSQVNEEKADVARSAFQKSNGTDQKKRKDSPTKVASARKKIARQSAPAEQQTKPTAIQKETSESIPKVVAKTVEFLEDWKALGAVSKNPKFDMIFSSRRANCYRRSRDLWLMIRKHFTITDETSKKRKPLYKDTLTQELKHALDKVDKLTTAVGALDNAKSKEESKGLSLPENAVQAFVEKLGGQGSDVATIPNDVKEAINKVSILIQRQKSQIGVESVSKMVEYLSLLERFITAS